MSDDVEDLREECARLRAQIAELQAEVERVRQLSSAGYARGRVKQAAIRTWPRRVETEDML